MPFGVDTKERIPLFPYCAYDNKRWVLNVCLAVNGARVQRMWHLYQLPLWLCEWRSSAARWLCLASLTLLSLPLPENYSNYHVSPWQWIWIWTQHYYIRGEIVLILFSLSGFSYPIHLSNIVMCCLQPFLLFHILSSPPPSHLAWKTRPKAPSPISLTYWILFRGYSRARSFEFSSRGTRWYMGLGCSRSSKSSDGRALSVGVSITLCTETRGVRNTKAHKEPCISSFLYVPFPVPPLLSPPATGEGDNGEENCSCKGSQDDNDDWHGVSWRRHCGHGRGARILMRARWLWLHHWKRHNSKSACQCQASLNKERP